jgi:hypothetical protein
MALIATAGASDANSYATYTEAEAYIETRLHADNWDDANDDDREAGLMMATALLDRLCNWDGDKASDSQALRWPRNYIYDPDGDSVDGDLIPQFLKDATAEFALHLLGDDLTETISRDLEGFKQIEVGSLNLVLDTEGGAYKKGMMPDSVWIIVRSYCVRIGKSNKLLVRV